MKITPLDIRQKTFESKFRGYDKDEVQAFLNSLSHEWERVQDDYKEMKIRYDGIQKEVEKLRQVENSLYKTLKTAEDTGASLIDQANRSAELQLREAQMKSDETIKTAKEKAKLIVENAERISKAILEEMKDAIKSVESDFHRLESMKENLLLELRNLSNDMLDKVEKHTTRKNKFDFDEHLKKAKSFARLNKDYSYYTFNPDEDPEPELPKPQPIENPIQAGEQPEPVGMQESVKEENSGADPVIEAKPDLEKPESISRDRQPDENEPEKRSREMEPARDETDKKQKRSFFDELE